MNYLLGLMGYEEIAKEGNVHRYASRVRAMAPISSTSRCCRW
jgi:hypothetical protein